MPDTDELDLQALLYACGEMGADETSAFEARLGCDQAAREALAEAVASLPPLFDNARPHPRYRAGVRARLGATSRVRERVGHALWAVGGAAAASLAFLGALSAGWLERTPSLAEPMVAAPEVLAPTPGPAESDQAVHFADLTTVERLARIHSEEAARKRRTGDWRQRHPLPEAVQPMMPPGMSPGMSPGTSPRPNSMM